MNEEPIPALIKQVIEEVRAHHPDRPALVGVGGAQGSGKSYWCDRVAANNPRIAHFSLDDVYQTRREREISVSVHGQPLPPLDGDLREKFQPGISSEEYNRRRAASAHLFLTRGPPGTHDLGLATGVIARLCKPTATLLPRFDKKTDDRAPEETWPRFDGPAEAVLTEGWCMGALPVKESPPTNDVEREDLLGEWRQWANYWLQQYQAFFGAFDALIYLQAPSFEIVRRWRGEQEEKLLGRPLTAPENAALDRFVQHYERITRAMLAGALRADWIVRLDENRNVTGIEQRG